MVLSFQTYAVGGTRASRLNAEALVDGEGDSTAQVLDDRAAIEVRKGTETQGQLQLITKKNDQELRCISSERARDGYKRKKVASKMKISPRGGPFAYKESTIIIEKPHKR